jgi:hypothetical protein
MRICRPAPRPAAWIALIAILFSTLLPAGAHGHGVTAEFDGHADLCSAMGPKSPAPAMPQPANGNSKVCTHCDGCTGSPGNVWAVQATATRTIALRATPPAIIVAEAPTPAPVDLIAAPPRGPPLFA